MRVKIHDGKNKYRVVDLEDTTIHGLLSALDVDVAKDRLYYRDDANHWILFELSQPTVVQEMLAKEREMVVQIQRGKKPQQQRVVQPPAPKNDANWWWRLTAWLTAVMLLLPLLKLLVIPLLAVAAGMYLYNNGDSVKKRLRQLLADEAPREQAKPAAVACKQKAPAYAKETEELVEMGFTDDAKLARALSKANGKKEKAIELYLRNE